MRNSVVLGVVVVLTLGVAGCNPFLDRLKDRSFPAGTRVLPVVTADASKLLTG